MAVWSSLKLGSAITKCLSSKKTDLLKSSGENTSYYANYSILSISLAKYLIQFLIRRT